MRMQVLSAVIECVPNFSEGRDRKVVDAIVAAAAAGGGKVLDVELDANHNRSVVTIAGPADAVLESAFRSVRKAADLIDLNLHHGEHPRMGAADVVPFVPLAGASMADCVSLAERLGKRIGDELGIPVFLYGEAARTPARRNLADVRKGQFEGLREAIGRDPARKPDFGPERIHPTAGATAVGARFFLLAFNVYLDTPDVSIAKKIAASIRESSGGLKAVRALGLYMADRNQAQISMNLVDYRITSPAAALEAISMMAAEHGASVTESEFVGLVPRDAILKTAAESLRIKEFREDCLIETRIEAPPS